MKNRIKILIDGVSLLSSFTGIARYTYENSKRIQDDINYESFYNYGYHSKNLYGPTNDNKTIGIIKKLQSIVVKSSLMKKTIRKLLKLSTKIISPSYDLYWQPNFIPDLNVKARRVVSTVHDFSFYLQPEWHPNERLEYFEEYFFKQVLKSDWLITGSYFTKSEIIKYLKFPEEKIHVIYHGVDHNLYKVYSQDILEKTKKKFELNDNFLLFVGSIEPRKNLINLLKAYHLLSDNIKKKLPLVLVGFKGWENDEVMLEIEKEKEYIKYLGYLSDLELAHVYNLATIFIYPSLYEGFGIPPLEAMSCGTAVIASNAASLPEACGDAVEYIRPNNVNEISQKIALLVNDNEKRKLLIQKGFDHAKQFTWDKAAKEHLEVFEKVLEL